MRIRTMDTTLAGALRYSPEDRDFLLERLRHAGFTYIDTGSPSDWWRRPVYHAGGFFQRFAADRHSALRPLKDAKAAGAEILSIGGEALPREIGAVCAEVRKRFTGVLGIRPEGTLAAAAAIEAIAQGFTLVAAPAVTLAQIAEWQDRLGHTLFDDCQLPELRRVARLAAELALPPAAEGGSAEVPGSPFEVLSYEVMVRHRGTGGSRNTATVALDFHGQVLTFTAGGAGPIDALDGALRGCLAGLYPAIGAVRLTDYRVMVLDRRHGAASRVRVAIDWTGGDRGWTTSGISHNVIDAAWTALSAAVRRELLCLASRDFSDALVADESWAV